jgi:hypothetical protein
MLRICYSRTKLAERWKLCGQLAGPWVVELRSCWKRSRRTAPAPDSVMDLSEVTFIDEGGERLLSEMRTAGVKLEATGIETKHLIENLNTKGERSLRRLV